MRDVGAEAAGLGETDEGVEVRAVDVHLAAVVVDPRTDLHDALLEHAVGRGVGDHDAGELLGVGGQLGVEIVEVDVAVRVARHDDDAQAGHHRARRIRTVGRRRDEAHVAPGVAPAAVIGADREQPGELALAAGVRLQAHGVVPRAGDEHLLELVDQLAVAERLFGRCERMDVGELGPGDGEHLGRGIELHRARAERNHRAVEREVLVGQPAKVAQHLVLAVVLTEDRMDEHLALAHQGGGQAERRVAVDHPAGRLDRERTEHGTHEGDVAALVERDTHMIGIDDAQVDACCVGCGVHGIGAAGHVHGERVEPRVVDDGDARRPKAGRQGGREPVHPSGDAAHAVRAVPHRVHAGHHRQEHLGGADVARRLLAPDVLLARLQCESQRRAAGAVGAHADEPSRQRAGVSVAAGEVGGVRTAEAHRDAEPLRRADHQVGTERAGRGEQHESQRVGGDDDDATRGVHALDDRRRIAHGARRPRVGEEDAVAGRRVEVGRRIADHDLDVDRLGPRADHRDGLRVGVSVDEEGGIWVLRKPAGHRHRLGCRGGLVEHRRVGEVHAGEVSDHRLVVEQRFQATLADLGLVRRVGRVPRRVLEHVAGDDRRRDRARVARADERREHLVERRDLAESGDDVRLGYGGPDAERVAPADRLGHHLIDQLGERGHPEDGTHRGDLRSVGADVALDEAVGPVEGGQ